MTKQYRYADAIVSTDWLDSNLQDPRLRIFDCTTKLEFLPAGEDAPYRVISGYREYLQGHIPGAAFLDIQNTLSDPDSPAHLRFSLASLNILADAFEQSGVGNDTRVILYSRGRCIWATRVWWMLHAIGFDDAAILDGGWDKWTSELRDISTEETCYSSGQLTTDFRSNVFVGKAEVLAAMADPNSHLVNALSCELHNGGPSPYGRSGHIPGSANVPSSSLADPDRQTIVPAQTAQAHFEALNIKPGDRAIAYCGGGIAATLDAFVLHQLGYQNVAVYDASMSEWARDESLPIETE